MKLIDKLTELSISIPEVNPALGSYVPYKRINNLIYISGQLPIVSGEISTGKVPVSVSIEDAKSAARVCIINTLPLIIEATNNIDIENIQCINISGFVNSEESFDNHPEVINGASDLISLIFEDAGMHTRAAVSCNSLPLGVSVEVDAIFELN